jgi:hypothetical protein
LAVPQPTGDPILSKLETEIKNEITKATKALAGNLAVSSLEDALFTCLATMEGGRQVKEHPPDSYCSRCSQEIPSKWNTTYGAEHYTAVHTFVQMH